MMAAAIKEAKAQLEAEAQYQRREYQPRGAMAELFNFQGDEFCLSGPAGTGKSRGTLEVINRDAWRYPRSRQAIVRKTRVSLTESGLVTFERYVLGEDNPICSGASRATRHVYTYPNGSEIIIAGLDNPVRLMSTEFDRIYIMEATESTQNDVEMCITRLRNGVMPFQQLLMDCNPDRPDHHIKQRADKGQLVMKETRHEDNPVLWDGQQWTARGEAYIKKLQSLTGVRYERLYLGKWVMAEGGVYADWRDLVHLIDWFEIPKEWTRFRAIDFGYTNPFVCQWWAADPDGRMYRYREIYRTQTLVEDVAKEIKRLSEGEHILYTVADHDAEDRATLMRHGVPTRPAQKAVSTGIQAVQSRLKPAGDGKPRLFMLRGALAHPPDAWLEENKKPYCTEQEIGGYVWQKTVEGKSNKEAPQPFDDHGMDTMRYAVMSVQQGMKAQGQRSNPFFK